MLCWVSSVIHREALQKKPEGSEEMLGHSVLCFVMLCCPLESSLFSTHPHTHTHLASRFSHSVQSLDCPLDCPPPVEPTVDFPSGLTRLRLHVPVLAQLRSIQSKQTICPLFTQILSPICDVCLALPEERGVNRCIGRGARVTAGHKNAYSSLWLVHKLAAGRLGGWG